MSDCSDVETTEADRPFLYLFRNYFKNSYGNGKYRGGAGVGFGIEDAPCAHAWPSAASDLARAIPATLGHLRRLRRAPGLCISTVRQSNMGTLAQRTPRPALPGRPWIRYTNLRATRRQGQREFHLEHISGTVQPCLNGDTFYVPIGGGAGYGDVLERDPKLVLADIKNGLCSHWAARHLYQVAYDEQTLRLDLEGTKQLRDQARKERIQKGVTFDEFDREWRKLRPPEAALEYFGTYPHPREGLAPG